MFTLSYRRDSIFLCKRTMYALNKFESKIDVVMVLSDPPVVVEGYIINKIYTNTIGFPTGIGNTEGNDMMGFTIGDVKFQTSGSVRSN